MTNALKDGQGLSPQTLPANIYYQPEIFELEKERVFYNSWQYIGHVSMLAEASSYVVRDICDQSVIVLRTTDGELRAYHNVCQHRAHRLLEGEGSLPPLIVCPYHTWSYDHEGQLRSARGTEDIEGFEKSAICLKSVRLDTLYGFIFVNFDDAAKSLNEMAPGLVSEFGQFAPNAADLVVSNRYSIDLAANWKNSIENFSECYHCPNQHKSLTENALDLKTYSIECYDIHHVHRSRDKGGDMGYEVTSAASGQPNEFRSFYIWPNTVLEVYPGGNLTAFHHVPEGPEKTSQIVEWYFPSAELTADEQAVVDFVHTVRLEDVPICESVQKGLHSKGYGAAGKGRLVIDPNRTDVSEHAIYHFQSMIRQALA